MSETAGASVYTAMASWLTPSCLFVIINLVIGTIAITSRFANTTKKQHQLARSPSMLNRLTSFNLRYHKYEPTTPHHSVVDPVQSPDSPRLDQVPSSSLLDRARSSNLDLAKGEIEGLNLVQSPDSPQLDQLPSSSLLDRVRSSNLDLAKREIEGLNSVQSPDSSRLDRVPSSSLLDWVKSFNLGFYKEEIEGLNPVQSPDLPRLDRVPSPSLLDRVRSFNLGLYKAEVERPDPIQQQLTRSPSILQRLKSLTFDRSGSVKEAEPEYEAEVTGGGELVEEREEEEKVDAKADDFIYRFRQQLRLQRLDSILRYRDMLKRN
ncbi:hypothetical protein E2542_SST01546 [Spatholobus suberectus]|nr:hypothetical protein E2542_SST01546 [Spatholobus suberectus]